MPNQNFTESPAIYSAGLKSAEITQPPDGENVRIRASHHIEAADRQALCFRAYPALQGLTSGEIHNSPIYGLFLAPPNAESFRIVFAFDYSEITSDCTFTVTYNSQAKTAVIPTGQADTGWIRLKMGPWALASAGGDTVQDLIISFSANVNVDVHMLHAEFSKKSL
jgi:hypothetical protein